MEEFERRSAARLANPSGLLTRIVDKFAAIVDDEPARAVSASPASPAGAPAPGRYATVASTPSAAA